MITTKLNVYVMNLSDIASYNKNHIWWF